jgi:hypothetical protein
MLVYYAGDITWIAWAPKPMPAGAHLTKHPCGYSVRFSITLCRAYLISSLCISL